MQSVLVYTPADWLPQGGPETRGIMALLSRCHRAPFPVVPVGGGEVQELYASVMKFLYPGGLFTSPETSRF